jgi:hypothetical protein
VLFTKFMNVIRDIFVDILIERPETATGIYNVPKGESIST